MGSMVAVASIVSVAGGQSDDYLAWILFGSMAICGIGSILQTFRFWRFGSGYPIGVNSGSSFIAVCTTILLDGGPAMLSTLIVASALLQFVFISKLSLLRRFITPTVSGTVIMLVSATIISVVLSRLTDMPEDAPAVTAPVLAGITLIVLLGTRMFGSPKWQQWGPIIAIITGCAVAAFWGLYDFQRVIDAPWVGIPTNQWPGFDLSFNATFWALLPGLVIVIMASTVRSISDTVTIQQVAWRRPRATDFRVVQGAHYLVALTNLFAALLGTLPNAIRGSNSARVILTGVASRRMGIYAGAILIAAALLPKIIALVVSIPRPVLVAFIVFMLSLLFVQGMRTVLSDGMDGRKAIVVGLSLWIGIGFQNQLIFPDLLTGTLKTLLSSGVTTGSICVIALTLLMDLMSTSRRRRLNIEMSMADLPKLDGFLRDFASRSGWDEASTGRLRSAGEETLTSLLTQEDDSAGGLVAEVRECHRRPRKKTPLAGVSRCTRSAPTGRSS